MILKKRKEKKTKSPEYFKNCYASHCLDRESYILEINISLKNGP